ncbi:MAG: hypothetical protein IJX16_00900 [Clostridia bacterium]|nr:hypothetical protein [Clostridia bacterium]
MKEKELTNEELEQILFKSVENSCKGMNKDLTISKVLMDIAEIILVESLDEKQRALYDEFCQKRKAFYKTAEKFYVKKLDT